MSPKLKFPLSGVLLLVLLVPILAACGGGTAGPPVVETVVVTTEPEVVVVTATPGEDTGSTEAPPDTDTPTAAEPVGQWRTPHPILSKLEVRQAIAYCTNRRDLIESVYPFLEDDEKDALLMNTFLPQGHWALAPDDKITVYEFDPEKGKTLLEEAGWTAENDGTVRFNEAGEPLTLKFTTTSAAFRQTWAAVLEQQLLENCGIQIIRTHAPGSWWFGNTTGLQRRDFELGAFAWVGQADPGGTTLYACNQIPLPDNNWEGQNYMAGATKPLAAPYSPPTTSWIGSSALSSSTSCSASSPPIWSACPCSTALRQRQPATTSSTSAPIRPPTRFS